MNKHSIKPTIENNILVMDGAMGTYYRSKFDNQEAFSEHANLSHPMRIQKIHQEYIEAGAKLIKTNTFSANPYSMNISWSEVEKTIVKGYEIASRAAQGKDAWVACSIGPLPEQQELSHEEQLTTYNRIIDIFLTQEAKLFIFETFSDTKIINELVNSIRTKDTDIEVIALFSVNYQGYTKKGIGLNKLLKDVSSQENLVSVGFNCGVGAGHMVQLMKTIELQTQMLIVSPNAGFPEKLLDRTSYQNNGEYFAERAIEMCQLGARIVGGCCGTTPTHIQAITDQMMHLKTIPQKLAPKVAKQKTALPPIENVFNKKLDQNEFVVAVELDPPYDIDVRKLMEAAHLLKAEGVDILTIADSPLGKVRLDSILMACKIKREVGIDVMPHLCCRDKNRIAIRAMLSAAYVEGIRNYLLVTGDPLSDGEHDEVKGVFNMNSVQLMSYAKEMNGGYPLEDPMIYGGALNPKLPNIKRVITRVKDKMAAGASYFLTQPIFDKKDIDHIKRIHEETGAKILGGILPLVSYKNARFIHNEFTGMNISEDVLNSFHPEMSRQESEDIGVKLAVNIAREMKPFVNGFYFMTPFNRASMIVRILKESQLR